MIPLTLESAKEAYRKAGMEPDENDMHETGLTAAILRSEHGEDIRLLGEEDSARILRISVAELEDIDIGFTLGFCAMTGDNDVTDLFREAYRLGAALRSEREENTGA